MVKSKDTGQIVDIHNNTWNISIKTGLQHPLLKKVCFRHIVSETPKCNRFAYVEFYITKFSSDNIQMLSGLWHNSNHHTACVSLTILKEMIEIAEKELLGKE